MRSAARCAAVWVRLLWGTGGAWLPDADAVITTTVSGTARLNARRSIDVVSQPPFPFLVVIGAESRIPTLREPQGRPELRRGRLVTEQRIDEGL